MSLGSFGELGNLLGQGIQGLGNVGSSLFSPSGGNTMGQDINQTPWYQGALTGDSAFGTDKNMGWLTGGARTFGDLAGAYSSIQGMNMAKDQMQYQKDYANTQNQQNVTNYNNDLAKTVAMSGQDYLPPGMTADEYLAKFGRQFTAVN